ncbi:hypothetical protein AsAng_0005290 [Aureispira anguillae]|uniref:Uncharacterized protein n=1 Tax=Aureispira anguillae TaxID=2864201 RepID=A0A915YB42_9BACT|nr:hypothetical protein AsAng_0005290 [Aureispira anguillae]
MPEGYNSEGEVYEELFNESIETGNETGVQLYLDEETSNVNFHFPVYSSRVKDIP